MFECRLAEVIEKTREQAAAAIVDAVNEAVWLWTAGQAPADDITLVAARRTA